jgi:hypothetical protein
MLQQILNPFYSQLNVLRHPVVVRYLVLLILAIALFGCITWIDLFLYKSGYSVPIHLAALVGIVLLLGLLLIWFLQRKMFMDYSNIHQSCLVVGIISIGMVVFAIVSPHWNEISYVTVYWPSLVLIGLPWFALSTIIELAGVPQLRFKLYVFDSLKDVIGAVDFTDELMGISWVFKDDFYEVDPSGIYQFRTFLPKDLKEHSLGKLFKCVISLHNINKHPEKPIHFMEDNEVYGWEFYDYPYWFWPQRKRYLDPQKLMKPSRFLFQKISEHQRVKLQTKLSPEFKATTIFITRSKIQIHEVYHS